MLWQSHTSLRKRSYPGLLATSALESQQGQQHECLNAQTVGINTGCIISVTMFAIVMNMLVKPAAEHRGPQSGICHLPICTFINNLTVSQSESQVNMLPKTPLDRTLFWCQRQRVYMLELTEY